MSLCLFLGESSIYSQDSSAVNFKAHEVTKGETSYGIAKKYQINLNDFFKANPQAANCLSKGEIVKIPIPIFSNNDSIVKKHVVKQGETLWTIAKIYGVQFSSIKSFNLLNTNELFKDQVLLIPNIIADTINEIKPLVKHVDHPLLKVCDTLVLHKVKKKETLYSISKNYGIPLDKIIKNNIFLENEGLKKGQELKIIYRIKDCIEDSIQTIPKELFKDSNSVKDNVLNISLLAPFFFKESDSIVKNCSENSKCELNKLAVKSFSFYNGIKIALNELKKEGYNLELTIYDTRFDTSIVKDILEDSTFKNTDLIIGPIYSKNVKLLRKYSKGFHIPLIPLFNIPSQALFNYPDIYKHKASRSTQSKEMANYLKVHNTDDNILLIADIDDRKSKVYESIFTDSYNDSILVNDSLIAQPDSIFPLFLKRGDEWEELHSKLSKRKNNLIVVCSNQIPFLTYAFNQLIEFSNSQNHYKSKYTIFGFEELYRMNTIDVKYKNKFNLHFTSVGLTNYDSKEVVKFIDHYKSVFSSEPTELAFDGYDITQSIILRLFPKENIDNYFFKGLKTDVDFNKIDINSGSENTIIKFYKLSYYNLIELSEN